MFSKVQCGQTLTTLPPLELAAFSAAIWSNTSWGMSVSIPEMDDLGCDDVGRSGTDRAA